jgi:hypothetical protein
MQLEIEPATDLAGFAILRPINFASGIFRDLTAARIGTG